MRRFAIILALLFITLLSSGQDSLSLQGQFSAWINYNKPNYLPLFSGIRYLPGLNYQVQTTKNRMVDFEASAHINGTAGMHLFDTIQTNGNIKPYRIWLRYSSDQFEIRAGLQKINFGSANLLRPLMWFDKIDPRDPLQLTDGVWGILGRYYFLNNANLWLWGLWGNEEPKTWETTGTSLKFPELGGRFQSPVPKGELALTYHYRKAKADTAFNSRLSSTGESRIGIDGKWDLGIGLWFEGSWTGKNHEQGLLTNQELFTLGADYTFGIGNGLNMILEHLVLSYDERAFEFLNPVSFTGITLSYPAGISDNISAIVFVDWTSKNSYTFFNWKHQFSRSALYLMLYSNPEQFAMPQQQSNSQIFAGKGIQIMFVLNH